MRAVSTGHFQHPDGSTDPLREVALSLPQAALIAHVAKRCPTTLSVEVGFGMGSSAAVILGARYDGGHEFQHLAFDPYGLPSGRGRVVRAYLETEFAGSFRLIEKRSEVGLALLADKHGAGQVGLVFIDGAHHFENVMADFVLADLLCCEGGYIIFDDAWFPAIETVINYARRNRKDYAIAHLAAPSTTVLQKIAPDDREWFEFCPFEVPTRRDWTSVCS